MKNHELKELYQYNQKENICYIDVQLENYRDAYSDWDFSPFTNRDLDDDLNEYLLECSSEIPRKVDIVIIFHILNESKDHSREMRSIEGMHNYFRYKIRKLVNQRIRLLKRTVTFLFIGTILLLIGNIFSRITSSAIAYTLISEGFYIGAWVMIWEMFSIWFFNVRELTYIIKHYRRLSETPIQFRYNESDNK